MPGQLRKNVALIEEKSLSGRMRDEFISFIMSR